MARVFRCPSCSMNLEVPDEYQGQDVRCSKCQTTIPINPKRSAPEVGEQSPTRRGSSEPRQEQGVRTGDPREGPPQRSRADRWNEDESESRQERTRREERNRDQQDDWDCDRRSERDRDRDRPERWSRESRGQDNYDQDDYDRDDSEENRYVRPRRDQRRSRHKEAERFATPPAIALLVVSGLKLMMALFLLPLEYITATRDPIPLLFDEDVIALILLGFGFFAVVIEALIIFGAVHLLRRTSYAWAMVASILAMVPYWAIHICVGLPVAIVSFGIGIWSLVMINQSPTYDAFG